MNNFERIKTALAAKGIRIARTVPPAKMTDEDMTFAVKSLMFLFPLEYSRTCEFDGKL